MHYAVPDRTLKVVLDTCILTELQIIRHEPDNRFLECALGVDAAYLITVNTAPGRFDRKQLQDVCIVTPGEFLNLPAVEPLVKELSGRG